MKETNLHDIKDEQIISKEEGKVVLEFVIPVIFLTVTFLNTNFYQL